MDFGREIYSYLPQAENREWLVTNGIGGFAMGTIPGLLTRRYHGLLIAALKPPLGRTLLLTKIDETLQYRGVDIPIYTNRWLDGTAEPDGYKFLERFHLEGSTPVWSFAVADALLEKRIWMERGSNTTYVKYTLSRASSPMAISAKTLVNAQDYHHTGRPFGWAIEVDPLADGLRFSTNNEETTFYLISKDASWLPRSEWHEGYYLKDKANRGQNDVIDANFYGGHCNYHFGPGLRVTLVASTDEFADLDGDQALDRKRKYEIQLLEKAEVNNLR